jgi:7-cyano-7-deazaguanine synthase
MTPAAGDITSGSSAVVLLSAGLDSTFNLLRALEKFSVRLVLTFDYGQKAAAREVDRARRIAEYFKVRHQIVALPWFSLFTRTALIQADTRVPAGHEVEIDNLTRSLETAKNVWVPNRNGIFLNIGAGFAEGLDADFVVPGFNSEEAQTFPDNSGAFLKALDQSWAFSTNSGVRTYCFSTELNKSQIIRESVRMRLPFSLLWPCYLAEEKWCGRCESCLRFKRAVEANGLSFAELRENAE